MKSPTKANLNDQILKAKSYLNLRRVKKQDASYTA